MHGFTFLVFAAAIAGSAGLPQVADRPLEELLTARQLRDYRKDTNYKKRLDVFRNAFADYSDTLYSAVKNQRLNQATELLGRVRALATYARNEPTRANVRPKDLRSKEVKKLEIELRKTIDAIEDMRKSVPFEYREGFAAATADLELLRDQLLRQLFELPE